MNVVTIIVTYNGLHWLDKCLGGLRASLQPTQVIVVDNGSTDGGPDHIRRTFPEVELIEAGRNLGFGQANNRAMMIALSRQADHVFLLNQDAWVLPETIGTLVEVAARNPDHGVLSPLHLNGAGNTLDLLFSRTIVQEQCPGLCADALLGRPFADVYPVRKAMAAAWLVTGRCLRTVGGFSPTFFHYGEDDNYVHRVQYHGLHVSVVPRARVHHDREDRPDSMSTDERWASKALVRYSDPNSAVAMEKEAGFFQRKMLADLLLFDVNMARSDRHRRRSILHMDRGTILRNRSLSMKPGPTFLNG